MTRPAHRPIGQASLFRPTSILTTNVWLNPRIAVGAGLPAIGGGYRGQARSYDPVNCAFLG